MKKIAIIITEGTEAIEAVVPLDMLVRAGNLVHFVSLQNTKIVCMQGKSPMIQADISFDEVSNWDQYDAIILPGGNGHMDFLKSEKLKGIINEFNSNNKIIGAICASGGVLGTYGVLDNRSGTAYPGYGTSKKTNWKQERVVIDKNIVTSQGPGTSFEFAYALIEKINNKETAQRIKKEMLIA